MTLLHPFILYHTVIWTSENWPLFYNRLMHAYWRLKKKIIKGMENYSSKEKQLYFQVLINTNKQMHGYLFLSMNRILYL